ncbi:putative lipid phosphate phosphatase 1 [Pseudovirgaria hyperparasitica]|uniref:Putative lipid phosphate phosphatase 1 n=1 Tax=Pseudovirgaria hyperparasitica TaxID=470096 RepID=A0A6A6W280_9PEZI|nr:putative lipid phosphate phosphatase 1 [Pseudovirgaria hyperparasitica]KAF2757028.1 putative lipid phosphate phosphatase 1 [Pseudovirgaria hyperparasitica]
MFNRDHRSNATGHTGGVINARNHGNTHSLYSRPTFGQWFKLTWADILTMVIMGVIGLGVYEAPPAPSRSFPIYFADGEIVYPQFAYPLRNEIIPIWAAALLAALVPISVFLIAQIRVRSFWDVNNATLGLLYSLITAAVFQVFLKCLIGGLRPHFLAVCKPNITPAMIAIATDPNADPSGSPLTGNGLGGIMFDRSICTGDNDQIDDALESFPSGHTTAAFAGFVFLSLYLNAKLKLFSNHHTPMWALILVFAPILGAVLIGGALTIDEYHNWYDVVAGAIIGTMFAFAAYRMVYAAVWDFRFNHVPLIRGTPFAYDRAASALEGFGTGVFTRKAGWGKGSNVNAGRSHHNGVVDNGHQNGLVDNGDHSGVGHGVANDTVNSTGHRRNSGIERRPVGGGYARGEQMV